MHESGSYSEQNDALRQLKELSEQWPLARELRRRKVEAFSKNLHSVIVEPITYEDIKNRQRGDGIADL